MLQTKRIPQLLALFFFAFSFSSASAQEDKEAFEIGNVERLYSESLQEDRILNVYLPQGYHPDSAAVYPVIYVLDGSAHEDFLHIVGLAQFMNMYQLLPPSIVVGIENVDRYRDFTEPSSDKQDLEALPTSGGSAAFIQFLKTEAKPLIESEYKTNGFSTIIGQSMGGLLGTEILFKYPEMFDQYILVSPSLWWNKQKMINKADKYVEKLASAKKKVFVSLGTEHPVMHKVADKLVESLRNLDNADLEVYYETLPDEDHATILHRAVYRAFENLYPKAAED
ncbi:MAG: alpha/beta hydrolase [Bacteroidetes bacterium]|nr:alpha/beta hydrolase [Bacteroidota bacterium]